MANILTYLDWRGDLTLENAPFNEVDNLILAELSYLDFGGIVPPTEAMGEGVPLRKAAEEFFRRRGKRSTEIDMGMLLPDEIPVLLERAAGSRRFGEMRLGCFADDLDTEKAEQFAAMAVELGDRSVYLAFRGTDDTIAGWKEDFLLGCVPEVPAQKRAADYARRAARVYPRRRLILGGHSKGGNLAVYAGIFCPEAVQNRIAAVYSNDGPGFGENVLTLPAHERLESRIHSIVPKSSTVGMLLEHEEHYTVVDSAQAGLLQHDGFSWQVLGDRFVTLREVSRRGRVNERALRDWVGALSPEQKTRFVDGLFDVLSASGAATMSELRADSFGSAKAMARAMKDMDRETRSALLSALGLLIRSNMKAALEEYAPGGGKKPAPGGKPSGRGN